MPIGSKAILTRMKHAPQRLGSALAALIGLAAAALPAREAAAQGLPLIRDTEIENLLNDYARPIFRAAGLGTGRVAMRIVRNDGFNAFVLDGRNVFIHTGTLMQAKTPNEVIGVIAHEAGHIAGGHMAALRARIAKDQTRALLVQLLGIGAMIGGAGRDDRDISGAGQGVMVGGSEIIMRSLLSERRSESAADQAGLNYLNATRQSGRGMLETFERFAQQEYVSDAHKDAFARSHPVATDRIARLRELVQASPHASAKDDAQLQLRHDLMRAKLSGYLERPTTVFNRYPVTDKSLPARYARAIGRFFQGGPGGLEAALAEVESPHPRAARQRLFLGGEGRSADALRPHAGGDPALAPSLKLNPSRASCACNWPPRCRARATRRPSPIGRVAPQVPDRGPERARLPAARDGLLQAGEAGRGRRRHRPGLFP